MFGFKETTLIKRCCGLALDTLGAPSERARPIFTTPNHARAPVFPFSFHARALPSRSHENHLLECEWHPLRAQKGLS